MYFSIDSMFGWLSERLHRDRPASALVQPSDTLGDVSAPVGRPLVDPDYADRLALEMHRREQAEQALRDREERTRLAVESADIGTWDYYPLTDELAASDRCKRMFGFEPSSEPSLADAVAHIHDEDRMAMQQAMQAALDPRGAGDYEIDYRIVWLDGETRWVIARGQAIFEEHPQRHAVRFIGTCIDITDRKLAEAATRAGEARLQAILDNATAYIYLKDLEGRYLLANRRCELVHSFKKDGLVSDSDILPPEIVAALRANDQQVVQSGEPMEFEEVMVNDDGPHTYITVKFPIKDAGGKVSAIGGISTDITDLRRTVDALETEQDLLRRTIELQEQERQLITLEIHDGLVQYATGALMQLEALRDHVEPKSMGDQIENIVEILRRTVAEGRRIINGIRTPVLDGLGIVAAVEQLIGEQNQANVEFEVICDDNLGRMAPHIEEALFRITQEALTNIGKHSQTKRAKIELSRAGQRVRLEVRDWGVGFKPAGGAKSVHGLKSMAHRARIAGGQCRVESAPGAGTAVVVDLPYEGKGQGAVAECGL